MMGMMGMMSVMSVMGSGGGQAADGRRRNTDVAGEGTSWEPKVAADGRGTASRLAGPSVSIGQGTRDTISFFIHCGHQVPRRGRWEALFQPPPNVCLSLGHRPSSACGTELPRPSAREAAASPAPPDPAQRIQGVRGVDLHGHHVQARALPQRSQTCAANGEAPADSALPAPLLSNHNVVVVLGRGVQVVAAVFPQSSSRNVSGSTVFQLPRRTNGNPAEGLLHSLAVRLNLLLAARRDEDVFRKRFRVEISGVVSSPALHISTLFRRCRRE